LVKGIKYDP
jgi:hypothetical protein